MRKGDKHGVRTVGLMNSIIEYGHEVRMKQLRSNGLDIKSACAVVIEREQDKQEVELSDEDIDFKEAYIEEKNRADKAEQRNSNLHKHYEVKIERLEKQVKNQVKVEEELNALRAKNELLK